MRWIYPVLTASLTLLTLVRAAEVPTPTAAPTPPNIVFILADDLGYGDLGSYGQTTIPTPNLDRLASDGMRFTQFYAGSTVCAPSRNVLMTGQHTGHIEVRGNRKIGLRPDDLVVASVLKSAGYATGIVGKWGIGAEGTDAMPLPKGFDFFYGYADQTHAHNSYPSFLIHNDTRITLPNVVPDEGIYGQGVASIKTVHSHDRFMAEALGFVDRHALHPFFLYLPLTLPHANNQGNNDGMEPPPGPTPDFIDPSWPKPERDFAHIIARLDADVGRLLAHLDSLGLTDQTLVIFTSDNGPHHEGGHDADFFASRGGLRGVKRDLYEGGVRVPFIARWPGHIAPGTTSDQQGSFADIMPTLANLVGSPTAANLPTDGIDLRPAFAGSTAPRGDAHPLYWEFYELRSAQAVRFGDWKAVRIPMLTGPIELYDLSTDLAEGHDVSALHPDVVDHALALMAQAHTPNPLWSPSQ